MDTAVQNEKTDLGTGKVGRLLFRLAIPTVAAQVVNVLYNMVDRMYIGHIDVIGAQALTGVGVCMPLIMIISAFAALAGMGGAPRASIMMGRGDYPAAEKILGNCTTLLLILAGVLTAVFLIFGRPMLMLFGASADTIGYAMQYMPIYAAGTVFVQIALGLNPFITAQGFAKTGMLTVLIGAALNIVLDPIFIFTFDLGVAGAALATILSQAVSCIWVFCFLAGKRAIVRLRPKNLRPEASVLLPCVLLGLSPFIMQFTESVIAVCFNASLQQYGGDIAVGAMTILTTVMQFSLLPLMGLSQGAQPIVSFNYGARNSGRVKQAFRLLLIASVLYSAALWALAMFAPQVLASIFTKDPALMDMTVYALRIYMASTVVFGVQIACQQTFIALGNAKTSLFLAVFRKILLLIPLIYLLPALIPDKVFAVYLAEPVADAIAVATTAIVFAVQFRRSMKQLDEEAAALAAES